MRKLTEEEKQELGEKIQEASTHRASLLSRNLFREMKSSFLFLLSCIRSVRLPDASKWGQCPICGAKMKGPYTPFRSVRDPSYLAYCPKCGYRG